MVLLAALLGQDRCCRSQRAGHQRSSLQVQVQILPYVAHKLKVVVLAVRLLSGTVAALDRWRPLARIGRVSIATRWRSSTSPPSAWCCQGAAIQRDVSGRTLRLRLWGQSMPPRAA
jgi:hypothetical protein